MSEVTGLSVYIPEDIRAQIKSYMQEERLKPEPEPAETKPVEPVKKTTHVVSGGYYGSTFTGLSPAENMIRFFIMKQELDRMFEEAKKKKVDLRFFPKLIQVGPDSQTDSINMEDASKTKESSGLQQYKTKNNYVAGNIIDKSL